MKEGPGEKQGPAHRSCFFSYLLAPSTEKQTTGDPKFPNQNALLGGLARTRHQWQSVHLTTKQMKLKIKNKLKLDY